MFRPHEPAAPMANLRLRVSRRPVWPYPVRDLIAIAAALALTLILARAVLATLLAIPTLTGPMPGCC